MLTNTHVKGWYVMVLQGNSGDRDGNRRARDGKVKPGPQSNGSLGNVARPMHCRQEALQI